MRLTLSLTQRPHPSQGKQREGMRKVAQLSKFAKTDQYEKRQLAGKQSRHKTRRKARRVLLLQGKERIPAQPGLRNTGANHCHGDEDPDRNARSRTLGSRYV